MSEYTQIDWEEHYQTLLDDAVVQRELQSKTATRLAECVTSHQKRNQELEKAESSLDEAERLIEFLVAMLDDLRPIARPVGLGARHLEQAKRFLAEGQR